MQTLKSTKRTHLRCLSDCVRVTYMDGVNDDDVVMEGVIDIVFVLEVELRSFTTPVMEVTMVWMPGEIRTTPAHVTQSRPLEPM
jgi:hypothetical protein